MQIKKYKHIILINIILNQYYGGSMESTLKRTWAEINLDTLKYNYNIIKNKIGMGVKFLGVVKADAYGHGAIQIAKTLEEVGANYLAVSSIDEAMELRLNGIKLPVLILGHTPKEQVGNLIKYNITQTVTCKAKAIEYSDEATRLKQTLKIHIKVDTGMSRLGYLCDKGFFENGIKGIVESINLPGLDAEGVFTHFAVADESDDRSQQFTKKQFKLFIDVVTHVEDISGLRFKIRHCANTGAVFNYPETYLDMVRPGLLLYGYGEYAIKMGLKPVMSLKTIVNTIKIYPLGTPISYGGIYVTDKTTRVGVLPYGYADGFFRSLSNKCTLMTSDGPARQIGKICMDMCMVDISEMERVRVGSEIEIFGEHNSIEKLAEIAGTIPYELTCAVSKRVPRDYYKNGVLIDKELLLRM